MGEEAKSVSSVMTDIAMEYGISRRRMDELNRIITNSINVMESNFHIKYIIHIIRSIEDITDEEKMFMSFYYGSVWTHNVIREQSRRR
ncbi:hypothetical protein KAT92_06490 [Candidatus Babeliales bacterium]|nr:hypothetical protein [Candidatus Babeliales bacterium]